MNRLRRSFARVIGSINYERDDGFRQVIRSLAGDGLFLVGLLGTVCTIALVSGYVISGRRLGLVYGTPGTVELWDKIFIVLICLAGMWTARTRFGGRWGRAIVAAMVYLVCIAIVLDDAAHGNIAFSAAYMSVALLAAIGTMPYNAWHALGLGLAVSFSYLFAVLYLPSFDSVQGLDLTTPRFVFLIIVTFMCTGLSAVLYDRRYQQFVARRRSDELKAQLENAFASLTESFGLLTEAQDRLIHAEKMASMGRLASGIAHEIANPLNFVNNFAEIIVELVGELRDGITEVGVDRQGKLEDIVVRLEETATRVTEHGRRADDIVKRMMKSAESASAEKSDVDLNGFVDHCLDQSMRDYTARFPDVPFEVAREYGDDVGMVALSTREMSLALATLLTNAFEAVRERAQTATRNFEPEVRIWTRRVNGMVEVHVADNGPGISEENQDRIFEPFYSTKRSTGLGLSLAHEIVTQGHGGMLMVDSVEGTGAEFVIAVPAKTGFNER